ncbi:MAG TPA: tyrosine-type recombinase/integrase [Phycisphaerae bacterium]|nr:tyrosine-type recombinase/integrase [Phycisphaerae bacterium]
MTAGFRDLADWTHTSPKQLVALHLTKSPNTERGYREDLGAFTAWMGNRTADQAVRELLESGRAAAKRLLVSWVNRMRSDKLSASTIRRRAASIRSLISTAGDPDIEIIGWQIGRLPNLPPAARVRDCTGPGRDDVMRMFVACRQRDDAIGRRNEAILSLLYYHALRAAEVLSIRLQDVDMDEPAIRICAKRGAGRMSLRLCQRTAAAVDRWLKDRGDDEERDAPLFSRCARWGGKALPQPLSYWGLLAMVRDVGETAGIRCWPHALRHAAITHVSARTHGSPAWGMALSRHRDVRAWMGYQDVQVSHVSAAEILSRDQIVSSEPDSADNQCW